MAARPRRVQRQAPPAVLIPAGIVPLNLTFLTAYQYIPPVSPQLYRSLPSTELPDCLQAIPDPPAKLFIRGDAALLQREPKIGVIGSREPSDYGRRLAAEVGAELASAGAVVVSGLARGIDGLSQQAVVEAGGRTIAVLGTAIDKIHPVSNQGLGRQIEEKGLIISEYAPGTEYRSFHFAEHNRLISGLCRALVIIEAAEASGTLITARYALDQGRELFAFPGPVDSPLSAGTHHLIRSGARLVRNAADILEDLGLGSTPQLPFEKDSVSPYNDREIKDPLLACLDRNPVHVDALLDQTGLKMPELSQRLLELELKGRVRQLPGQRYVRT